MEKFPDYPGRPCFGGGASIPPPKAMFFLEFLALSLLRWANHFLW